MSELTAMEAGFLHANQLGLKCHKTSENVFEDARSAVLFALKEKKRNAKESSESPNDSKDCSSNSAMIPETPFPSLASELLSGTEPKEWIEKYCPQAETIEGPAILLLAGSMLLVNLVRVKDLRLRLL